MSRSNEVAEALAGTGDRGKLPFAEFVPPAQFVLELAPPGGRMTAKRNCGRSEEKPLELSEETELLSTVDRSSTLDELETLFPGAGIHCQKTREGVPTVWISADEAPAVLRHP